MQSLPQFCRLTAAAQTAVRDRKVIHKSNCGEATMIGMTFIGFLILLTISVLVSAVLHYGCRYYVMPGAWSFGSKVVVGWIGAWLGSPVFGYWPHQIPNLQHGNIWFIPAILGALALIIVAVDISTMMRSARQ
jgi:uncharacterized membrane protein YeaQ/YmgE (transglycosylase-associated protein family)